MESRPPSPSLLEPVSRHGAVPGSGRRGPAGGMRALIPVSRRALIAPAPLAAVLAAVFVVAGGGLVGAPPAWLGLTGAAGVVAAVVLLTYLPERGWRPVVGCSPCAAMSVVSVAVALGLVATAPHDVVKASLALGVVLLGLVQRIGDSRTSCPA